MSDYLDETSTNAPAFSVSELSQSLKRTVEDAFGHVRVRGELSGVKRAASGHLYLALKDDNAVLDGVCWRGTAGRLSFRPEDGLEVICTGKLTTYAGRSKYQLVIEQMEPAGVGALMALLEERKKKLAAEGLFAPERKKPIPFLPETIGVVTSPTGSVIRDIIHRLEDRFPRRVLVWPVAVQGERAAEKVAAAIRGFDALTGETLPKPDVLIVARGGGSIEDLWSFNEEVVARAVADCSIPLISAVGHETDTTLIDYVSDRRAPTPTGAAEMAVPVRDELVATIADYDKRLALSRARMLDSRRERLDALARALPRPDALMGLKSQRLDDVSDRLPRSLSVLLGKSQSKLAEVSGGLKPILLRRLVERGAERSENVARRLEKETRNKVSILSDQLQAIGRMMESLSYERVLDRGFVLVESSDGSPVTEGAGLEDGDALNLRFRDTARSVMVTGSPPSQPAKAPKKSQSPALTKKKTSKPAPPEQGNLF